MNKIILLALCLALTITGCKVRQVDREKSHTKQTLDSASTQKEQTNTVDTSKKITQTKQKTTDSTATEVEITTDSGQIQHLEVDKNGKTSFTGKAKKIKIKTHGLKKTDIDTKTQDNKHKSTSHDAIKASNTHKTLDASVNNKHIQSSIDVAKTAELICLLLVIAAGVFLAIKFYLR